MSKLERGRARPSLDALSRTASALSAPPSSLLLLAENAAELAASQGIFVAMTLLEGEGSPDLVWITAASARGLVEAALWPSVLQRARSGYRLS